ncbi:unnamed protein product [Closterium sp. NIES-65]|nr:unnamed protein product [Closterium sp. NIES-65]
MPLSRVSNSRRPTSRAASRASPAAFKAALRLRSSRSSRWSSSSSQGRHHNALSLLVPLLLAALLVPRAADAACSRVRQVVVVGAGMSGVSAAYRIVTHSGGECFNVRTAGLLISLNFPLPLLPSPLFPSFALFFLRPPPLPSGDCGGGARRQGDGGGGARQVTVVEARGRVTVVEARGRVGGRMWSRTEAAPAGSPTTFLRGEMGAQWIEGATGNPVTTLARKFKLNIAQQNGREIQFTAKGRRYGDAEWAAAEAEYQTLVRQALAWAGKQNKDVSLQQAFTSGPWKRKMFYKPYAQSRLAVDYEFNFGTAISHVSHTPIWAFPSRSGLRSRLAVDYEFNFGTALSHLSAWYYDSDAFDPPTMVVTNGYDNIPKMLMQEAQGKGAKLLLNFEVTAISQSSTGVQITGKNTASGATGTLDADVVIVTIPLGVLKANTIAFSPSLPPRKTGAIARLGVGAIAKIFFFFNQTFWPVNVDEYFIEDAQLPANRGRWVDWVNLKRAWGQTALEGVALGEYAVRMATMSDEEVIKDAKAKMARMFPQYRKKPLEPLATWIQRWTAEPYSRGAYSYARVGVRGNEDHCTDYDVMALPEGRVLFAGEHTIWQYQATVHGALLSGVREAKRVLRNF